MKVLPNTGYSGKPLAQKLGLKQEMNAFFVSAPKEYNSWIGTEAAGFRKNSLPPWDFIHLFTNSLDELENLLSKFRYDIQPDGMIWVSYYKKSSGLESEITEDLIRKTCFPLGFVDIKVCAVSPEWSGLKLVIRKKLR